MKTETKPTIIDYNKQTSLLSIRFQQNLHPNHNAKIEC